VSFVHHGDSASQLHCFGLASVDGDQRGGTKNRPLELPVDFRLMNPLSLLVAFLEAVPVRKEALRCHNKSVTEQRFNA
jgi:hypothetical protein